MHDSPKPPQPTFIQRLLRWLKRGGQFAVIMLLTSIVIDHFRRPHMPQGAANVPFVSLQQRTPQTLAQISQDQTVLLYFWGSWCGICRHTSPAVHALQQDGVRVIGVALQSGDDAAIAAYLQQHGWAFDTLNDANGQFSRHWGIKATPSIVLVRNGQAIHSTTGLASYWGLKTRIWAADWLN